MWIRTRRHLNWKHVCQIVSALLFCSTGILLGCVSIWYSCQHSIFSAFTVELDWLAATSRHAASCQLSTFPPGSGCLSPRVELRTMDTDSALGEKCEEDESDASGEDELPCEQNQ